jgi:hypothetical protein
MSVITIPKLGRFFALIAMAAVMTGCGNNFKVSEVKVATQDMGGDAYASVQANVRTGRMRLPSFELPILDPKNPQEIYGRLRSQQIAGLQGSQITIALNLSKSIKAPFAEPVLPNGDPLPIGGLEDAAVVALPVAQTRAKIYVALGEGIAVIGTALPIKEFDSFTGYVPGLNLFPVFCFERGICASAGAFVGEREGESGLGLFVDAGAALYRDAREKGVELSTLGVGSHGIATTAEADGVGSHGLVKVQVVEKQPRRRSKNRFFRKYMELEDSHQTGVVSLH